MFLNPGKCQYKFTEITSSNNEKLLSVLTDKKISFDVHIKSLFKKAGQKLSALTKLNS